MEIRVWLSNGTSHKNHDKIFIPNEDFEGLNKEDRNDLIDEYVDIWAENQTDWGWEIAEEETE